MRHVERRRGFTLVELLVVIAILGLLLAILIPTLAKARESGNTVKCAVNLRNLGQAMTMYLAANKQTYPPSYVYRPPPSWPGKPDMFGRPEFGYIHWSSYILGAQPTGALIEAFRCPSLLEGGLPPTNPSDADLMSGQKRDRDFTGTQYDAQVSRIAYTANEAIMPRNKFNDSIRGASGISAMWYQYVKSNMIKDNANVVLITEFWPDWRIVSEASNDPDEPVKSHRPVAGYYAIRGTKGTDLVAGVTISGGLRSSGAYTHARLGPTEVDNPVTAESGASNMLGWIGRNHGSSKRDARNRDLRKTNFLFADGHVETKTIEETLTPKFQWGDPYRIYSLPGANVRK